MPKLCQSGILEKKKLRGGRFHEKKMWKLRIMKMHKDHARLLMGELKRGGRGGGG